MHRVFVLAAASVALFAGSLLAGNETQYQYGGRAIVQGIGSTYPQDSLFEDIIGSSSKDLNAGARLALGADRGRWDVRADYQLLGLHGDSLEIGRSLPPGAGTFSAGRVPNDDRRLFDLTYTLDDGDDYELLHRFDRLSVGHTREKSVWRFGRQAITWGNGLIYAPMDIFNPFDPAAVDTEFKTGDDMLYGQYLRDSGDDVQSVLVFRRNLVNGDVEADESALAFKYHGMANAGEYDVLAAQNYDDGLIGAGGNVDIGGGILRGDLVVTATDDDTIAQLVTSFSQSWIWDGRNVSGVIEYFFNGFGQSAGEYSPAEIADNEALAERLLRGELFTLGRHYVAMSATIEMTPLFLLTPNLFVNAVDPSALVQINTQNDLRQDLVLLGSLAIPVGASGTEFGGPDSGIPGAYLSTDLSLFVQLAWYF